MNFSEALGYSFKGQNIPKILTIVLVFVILIVWLLVSKRLIFFYKIELTNILNSLTGSIKPENEEVMKKLSQLLNKGKGWRGIAAQL